MDSDSSIKYPWQQTLLDAFMERDPDQLREKIASAEKIISERIIAPPAIRMNKLLLKMVCAHCGRWPEWRKRTENRQRKRSPDGCDICPV
jgi:hypothetical protein